MVGAVRSSPLRRSVRACALALGLAPLAGGCDDLSMFRGKFKGDIVQGNFVRSCFAAETEATLVFDPDHANVRASELPEGERNRLTTTDGSFTDTVLEAIEALPHDPLSELDFPGPRRLRNYVLFARPSKGPLAGRDAFVVVSLLANERVELRIIARTEETTTPCAAELESASDGGVAAPKRAAREYFGLFNLNSQ